MSAKRDAVAQELRRLAKRGRLDPKAIVQAARDEASPLHSRFTWEDGAAAEKWRLHEARNLIRVYAMQEMEKSEPDTSSVFVSLRSERGEGYRALSDVLSDDDLREQLLENAAEDMKYFRLKYKRLTELQPVFDAMDKVPVRARVREVKRKAA